MGKDLIAALQKFRVPQCKGWIGAQGAHIQLRNEADDRDSTEIIPTIDTIRYEMRKAYETHFYRTTMPFQCE